MDNLPTQLNMVQMKKAIDSLIAQKAPQSVIQDMVNKYTRDKIGNFTLTDSIDTRNVAQKGFGMFMDPIIETGVNAGRAVGALALKGADAISGGALGKLTPEGNMDDALNRSLNEKTTVPILGTDIKPVDDITVKNTLGNAVSTVALGVNSPVIAGGMMMGGAAAAEDKSAGSIALNTLGGMLGAKVLEYGFKAASPFIEKAVMKYGTPIIERLSQYVPESGKAFMKNLESKIPAMSTEGKILPEGVSNTINKTNEAVSSAVDNTIAKGEQKVVNLAYKFKPEAPSIMNRVARLNPTTANEFNDKFGMTHGEYLARSGNMGTPDKIIENEAIKFTKSLAETDTAIGKLEGVYKNDALKTMANELNSRELRVSSPGAPSADLKTAQELYIKLNKEGLSMEEINTLKRLYERNVKLGYNFMTEGEKITRATNIDKAVREWQFAQAEQLGLKNLPELNRQTQISKFIVDELGKKMIGQEGNNLVSLTDTILIAGGSPEAVSSFLVKKVFSSKGFQARVAKIVADNPSIKTLEAELVPTIENTLRSEFPSGVPKQLEAGGSKTIENRVPIKLRGESTIESPAIEIRKTSVNPKTGTHYVKNPKTGKMEIIQTKTSKQESQQLLKKSEATYKDIIPPKEVKVNTKLKDTYVNIGMDVKDGTKLTENEINEALAEFRVSIVRSKIHQSGTEPTFVAKLSRPLSPEELFQLSVKLRQDAIPQISKGTGIMTGPNAKDWGDFNPEYFMNLNGKSLKGKGTIPENSETITAYHGTSPENANKIKKNGFSVEKGANGQILGEGIYLDKTGGNGAKLYGSEVLEINIPKNLKLFKANPVELSITETNYGEPAKITQYLKSKGYDGVEANNQIVIFDPKLLKVSSKENSKINNGVKFTHYSGKKDLTELNPKKFGTGVSSSESIRKRTFPEYWVDRINVYTKQPQNEVRVNSLPNKYTGIIEGELLKSTDKIFKKLSEIAKKQVIKENGIAVYDAVLSLTEKLAKKEGYVGIEYPTQGTILFNKTKVSSNN